MAQQKKTTPMTAEQRAQIDHDAQINGELYPETTLTSEGITVAEAQRRARQANDDWHNQRMAAAKAAAEAAAKPADNGAGTPAVENK